MTTSIPEAPGSGRTWDYRYCWLRDAFYVLAAFRRLGHFEEREQFTQYILDVAGRRAGARAGAALPRRRDARPRGARAARAGAGYGGDGPVRVGNGAALHTAERRVRRDGRSRSRRCSSTSGSGTSAPPRRSTCSAARAQGGLRRRAAGRRHLGVPQRSGRRRRSRRLMCWAAADRVVEGRRAARARRRRGVRAPRRRASATRSSRRCWTPRPRSLRGVVRRRTTSTRRCSSSSPLRFCPRGRPRLAATVDAIARDLARDDWLDRYRHDDGFGRPEVAFIICTFWLVEALAGLGRAEEARALLDRGVQALSPLGLLAEDYDPRARRLWGNFPQAYSHVGPDPRGVRGLAPLARGAVKHPPGSPEAWRWVVLGLSALLFICSMFYRVANAVVAPQLQRDLGLSSEALGGVSAAFFYAFALAQVPLAVFLDRVGRQVEHDRPHARRRGGSPRLRERRRGGGRHGRARPPRRRDGREPHGLAEAREPLVLAPGVRDGRRRARGARHPRQPPRDDAARAAGRGGRVAALVRAHRRRHRGRRRRVLGARPGGAPLRVALALRGGAAAPSPGWPRRSSRARTTGSSPSRPSSATGRSSPSRGSGWGPYLIDVVGLSMLQAANLILLLNLSFVLGAPLGGWLSDRVLSSRKRLSLVGLAGTALAEVALAFFGRRRDHLGRRARPRRARGDRVLRAGGLRARQGRHAAAHVGDGHDRRELLRHARGGDVPPRDGVDPRPRARARRRAGAPPDTAPRSWWRPPPWRSRSSSTS